jgi:hypothetical protein
MTNTFKVVLHVNPEWIIEGLDSPFIQQYIRDADKFILYFQKLEGITYELTLAKFIINGDVFRAVDGIAGPDRTFGIYSDSTLLVQYDVYGWTP